MDQFSEEEMGSGFMAQPSLHIVLCMDCAWKHFWITLVIIFLKTRDLRDTTGISPKAENHGQVERKEEKAG